MDQWLSDARDALAQTSGVPTERLELDDEAVRELLELARVAAHDSGERTNAPLLCYLAGLVRSRHPELSVAALVAAADES